MKQTEVVGSCLYCQLSRSVTPSGLITRKLLRGFAPCYGALPTQLGPTMPPTLARLFALMLLACAALGTSTLAHEIPDARIDRALQVVVLPGLLKLDYEVSLAELTAVQDLRRLEGQLSGLDRNQLLERYGEVVGALNARGIQVEVDGVEAPLGIQGFELTIQEHPRYLFHLQCGLPVRGRVEVRDQNYISSEGTSRLAVRPEGDATISGYSGPGDVEEVPNRPVWMMDDAEEAATHQVAFEFESSGPSRRTSVSPAPAVEANPQEGPESGVRVDSTSRTTLSRLLGPVQGWGTVLTWCLALLLGGIHGLQPGHGKTLVIAATASSRHPAAGLVVAMATTLTHMSSVILIAVLLWFSGSTSYSAIQTPLMHAAGFVIATTGMYRLGTALGGQPRQAGVKNGVPPKPQGLKELALLGISGGVVPCWDAVLLLLLADLGGRLAWGIMLLLGFSLGMAAVLTAVGLGAGRVRFWLTSLADFPNIERDLSLLAGVALTTLGGYLWILA